MDEDSDVLWCDTNVCNDYVEHWLAFFAWDLKFVARRSSTTNSIKFSISFKPSRFEKELRQTRIYAF